MIYIIVYFVLLALWVAYDMRVAPLCDEDGRIVKH
jgi:hypothetical protein